jgi:hypothetical protein
VAQPPGIRRDNVDHNAVVLFLPDLQLRLPRNRPQSTPGWRQRNAGEKQRTAENQVYSSSETAKAARTLPISVKFLHGSSFFIHIRLTTTPRDPSGPAGN